MLLPFIYKKYCDRKLEVITNHMDKNDEILDAGCGNKNHPYCFLRLSKDYKVTGIDLDNSWHPKIIKGDIRNLEFKDKSFDVVLCLDVLEHIENWQKAFEELFRVARKKVIICVPITKNKIFFRLMQFLRKVIGIDNFIFVGHYRDFFPKQIINLVKNKGFSYNLVKIKSANAILSTFFKKTNLLHGGIFIIDKNYFFKK